MTDMNGNDQQMTRGGHFVDGAAGSMNGTTAATAMPSLPQVQQADPVFKGGSALEIPNTIRSVNGQSDKSYIQTMLPYADKSSPMAQAQQGEAQEAQGIQQ